jgi:anti-sigma B factor antagonist
MTSIVKVFQPTGILERNTADILRREISDVVNSGANTVLLDLGKVTFIDSSGLSALVAIKRNLQPAGAKLYIAFSNET